MVPKQSQPVEQGQPPKRTRKKKPKHYRREHDAQAKGMSAKEIRHDRFLRVASKRTKKALEALRLLGATSNRRVYLYEPDEVARVLDAVEKQLASVRNQFAPGRKREVVDFSLLEDSGE